MSALNMCPRCGQVGMAGITHACVFPQSLRVVPTTAEIESLRAALDRAEAERQQAQQERDGYLKRVDEVNAERMRQEVRAEQAIDALDKVTRAGTVTEACRIASVALEKLGESR